MQGARTSPLLLVGALLGGVAVGVISVIYHSALMPFGTIAAVGMILAFAIGLRLVVRTRWLALLGLGAVFTVVVLLAGIDNQGSVLVMGNTAGLAFLGFSTLAATTAIAWPRFSTRPTSYDRHAGIPERTLPQ